MQGRANEKPPNLILGISRFKVNPFNNPSSMEQGGQQQVQVRFVTQQTKHVVPDTAILVPAELRRYGLSGIVNSMLGYGKYTE